MATTKTPSIQLTRSGIKAIAAPYRWLLIQALVFFAAAGHYSLPGAWLYFGLALASTLSNTYFFWRVNPDLANQRGKAQAGSKSWDLILLSLYFLAFLVIVPLIAGLDVGRYHNSYRGSSLIALGAIIYLFFSLVTHWAMHANRHFEGTVRIQKDREHAVINTGPYRFIRHPGYLAMLACGLATPLMMGSVWAILAAGVASILLIVRTGLEDATLKKELPGYSEYAVQTPYRLIPFIW